MFNDSYKNDDGVSSSAVQFTSQTDKASVFKPSKLMLHLYGPRVFADKSPVSKGLDLNEMNVSEDSYKNNKAATMVFVDFTQLELKEEKEEEEKNVREASDNNDVGASSSTYVQTATVQRERDKGLVFKLNPPSKSIIRTFQTLLSNGLDCKEMKTKQFSSEKSVVRECSSSVGIGIGRDKETSFSVCKNPHHLFIRPPAQRRLSNEILLSNVPQPGRYYKLILHINCDSILADLTPRGGWWLSNQVNVGVTCVNCGMYTLITIDYDYLNRRCTRCDHKINAILVVAFQYENISLSKTKRVFSLALISFHGIIPIPDDVTLAWDCIWYLPTVPRSINNFVECAFGIEANLPPPNIIENVTTNPRNYEDVLLQLNLTFVEELEEE